MKTIHIFTAAILLLTSGLNAQSNKAEGIISYSMIMNVHASLSKEQAIYKSMIPETIKSPLNIYFKDGNYKTETLKPEKSEEGGVSISMSGANLNQVVRNDKKTAYTIYKKGTKTYYTENNIKAAMLSADKKSIKKILGYTCYKAIYKSEGEQYELWITHELKTACSPMEVGLVDGTVLAIHSKKVNYEALKIDFKPQAVALFEIPATYKKISKEQAEDLEEELNEELTQPKK